MKVTRSLLITALVAVWPGAASAQYAGNQADVKSTVEHWVTEAVRLVERELAAQRRGGPGPARGQEYTDTLSRTARLGRGGTLDLQNVSGDIVVTGGGGDDVRVEATKRVRHPDEAEARTLLEEMQVIVSERAGSVDIRTEYPRRRNWFGGVDYAVSVPREASVTLRSVSGDVRVANVNGELRIETVSGDITASATRRIRLARTVSGELQISQAESDELTAGTVSGRMVISDVKARTVDARTVSGQLRLSNMEAERVSIRSVSGHLEYSGPLSRTGRYEFQSHSGDVRIVPTNPRAFSVEATTFSGDVQSDYPLTLQSSREGGRAPRGGTRSIRGTFGEAGGAVVVQSFSGAIAIVKR